MRFILSIVLLSIATTVSAQNETTLDPVTITSTRIAQPVSQTGRHITVLDGRLFNQMPVNAIDELLRYVPGVEMQFRGPAGAQSDIVIRGGTFQQVLVLLDGVKLNDPITGHFSSYFPIAPSEIERIEILRGPAAALYGAEAVGGVVHIISKTFNRQPGQHKEQAGINVEAGQYNWYSANLGWYKANKKTSWAAGFLTNNTTGQFLRGTNRGYLYNHTASASLQTALGKQWTLFLRSSFDRRDFAAQQFYTTFASDTATEKVTTWWNQAKLRHQKGNTTDEIDLAYKQTNDRFQFNSGSTPNENRSAWFNLQYIRRQQVDPQWQLAYGLQADRRAIRSNDRGNHQAYHAALFFSAGFQRNGLRLNPALRLDYDENFGVELLPQLNMAYQHRKWVFRGSAGRAIRSADFTERFNNYNRTLVRSGSIGNPDLQTERSWSYDIGIDYTHSFFRAGIGAFSRVQTNLIDWVPTPYANMPRRGNLIPTGSYALSKNIKSLTTNGIEAIIGLHRQWKKHILTADIGLTLLRSTGSDSIPSFYILSHAKMLIQGSLLYQCRRFSLALNSSYKERNPQTAPAIKANISSSYWLVNVKIGMMLWRTIGIYTTINNIGNQDYGDLLGSRMPRRWIMGGVRWTLN
jgi:vitamin B12 transporter